MRKKHNKEDILDAGIEILRTKGYNRTGIDDILRASNIPKGSFYNFFNTKEDYGIQVLRRYTDVQFEHINKFFKDESLSALDRLKNFYKWAIQGNIDEECKKGCLIGNITQEMGGQSDSLSFTADESLKKIVGLIINCIEEGQRQEEIRNDYNATELGNFVHNSFYGALMRSKAGRDSSHFDIFWKMIFEYLKG
jgi:TetR/AcrR family transcriptional repressor of nem operon